MIVLRHIQRERPAVIFARAVIHEACQRFLAMLGHRVAAAQRGAQKIAKARDDDKIDDARTVVDEADWHTLQAETQRQLETVAKDGAKEGLLQVDAELAGYLDQANERAVKWAEKRAGELVKEISETTRDRVREIVAAGLEAGEENAAIAAELDDSYWFGADRAETIARTETATADLEGNRIGWRGSGGVAGREWRTSQEDPCEECAAMDGEVVGINEEFEGGNAPLHPRCECVELPVLADDSDVSGGE